MCEMRTKRDTQRDSKTERQADRDLDGFSMPFVPQSHEAVMRSTNQERVTATVGFYTVQS